MNILPLSKILESFARLAKAFNIEFVSGDRKYIKEFIHSSDDGVNNKIDAYSHECNNNILVVHDADVQDVERKLCINNDITELFLDTPDYCNFSNQVKIINESNELCKQVIVIFL